MKIKKQKPLNLPQLIEWGFNNPNLVKGKLFLTKEHDEYSPYVQFSVDGYGVRTSQSISNDDTFTVEVEEEFTEDTVIPKLLTTFETINVKNKVRYQRVRIDENYPIKLMLNKAEEHREPVETLHVVNDDGTHTLIWRDGKLVE